MTDRSNSSISSGASKVASADSPNSPVTSTLSIASPEGAAASQRSSGAAASAEGAAVSASSGVSPPPHPASASEATARDAMVSERRRTVIPQSVSADPPILPHLDYVRADAPPVALAASDSRLGIRSTYPEMMSDSPAGTPHTPSWAYTFGRRLVTPLARAVYRPRVEGKHHVPKRGAVILASNHLSFIDSIAIPVAAAPRP